MVSTRGYLYQSCEIMLQFANVSHKKVTTGYHIDLLHLQKYQCLIGYIFSLVLNTETIIYTKIETSFQTYYIKRYDQF
jgi:hypothetical protein